MKKILLALTLVFCQYAVAHAFTTYSSYTSTAGSAYQFGLAVSGIPATCISTTTGATLTVGSATITYMDYLGDGVFRSSSTLRTLNKSGAGSCSTLIALSDLTGTVITLKTVYVSINYVNAMNVTEFTDVVAAFIRSPYPVYTKDLLGTSISPKGITLVLTGVPSGTPLM